MSSFEYTKNQTYERCNDSFPNIRKVNFSTPFQVYAIMKDFGVTDDDLKKYMKLLMADLHKGLAKATHPKSIVKCYPTYIQDLPTGQGKYINRCS